MPAFFEKRYGWALRLGRADYERTLTWQRGLAKMRLEGLARDTIMLVEHPPVITVGRDGHEENYRSLKAKPFFVERGGDVTYHGPGQLVVYFIFNLARRNRDIRKFMADIQEGIVHALKEIGIESQSGEQHTGVWVGGKKIASIGVAVKQWITLHGAAVNLNTRLRDYKKIHPCGLEAEVMTSARRILGKPVSLTKFGEKLIDHYAAIFDTDFATIALEELAEELQSQAGGQTV